MKRKILLQAHILILSFMMVHQFAQAQAPTLLWQKCIGGPRDEGIYNMIKLQDGNYLFCGQTNSPTGDFKARKGNYDAFLLKTDGLGNTIWTETYGGSRDEIFYNLRELANGDILAIGTTGSNNKQVSGNHGAPGTDDVWLIRTNKYGKLIHQHCFGGSGSEATPQLGESQGLLVDSQGNILFTAQTNSDDSDVSNNHGDYDGWVVKLNPAFEMEWAITIGDTAYDAMYTIAAINGHYLVTGTKATRTFNTPNLHDYFKAHAAKIDPSGNIIWHKVYGGSTSDDCNAALVSEDNNLILTGHASSPDGDVAGNDGFKTWTWKIDINDNGKILWQNLTGIPGDTAAAFNIAATHDGGYLAMGGVGHPINGIFDAYVVKVDSTGNTQWTKRMGRSEYDAIQCGLEVSRGMMLMGGMTSSNDGDVSESHGGPGDAWLVELTFDNQER
jgi:hypothetical protein